MKILHFQAGLGNQMFQFAFYRYLLSLGYTDIYFDTSSPSLKSHQGFELKRIFPKINELDNFLPDIVTRPLFLLGDVSKKLFRYDLSTDCGCPSDPKLSRNKFWIRGFWQEYTYVNLLRTQLLSDFTFIPFDNNHNLKYIRQIESSESVSIHVRRGDYLKPGQRIFFGDINTLEYYKEAISIIKEKTSNPAFFIFSDNIEWVRKNLQIVNAVYIQGNTGKNSFRDMQLMSKCKHQIIANSSFSWWGAWLNTYEQKTVVAPAKWMNNHHDPTASSLIPPQWLRAGKIRPNISLIIKTSLSTIDLNNLLRQSYSDYEIILPSGYHSSDKKIKINQEPTGNHVFNIDAEEIAFFSDKKYLKNKLKKYFIRSAGHV